MSLAASRPVPSAMRSTPRPPASAFFLPDRLLTPTRRAERAGLEGRGRPCHDPTRSLRRGMALPFARFPPTQAASPSLPTATLHDPRPSGSRPPSVVRTQVVFRIQVGIEVLGSFRGGRGRELAPLPSSRLGHRLTFAIPPSSVIRAHLASVLLRGLVVHHCVVSIVLAHSSIGVEVHLLLFRRLELFGRP